MYNIKTLIYCINLQVSRCIIFTKVQFMIMIKNLKNILAVLVFVMSIIFTINTAMASCYFDDWDNYVCDNGNTGSYQYDPFTWTGYDSTGSYGTGLNNPGTTYVSTDCSYYGDCYTPTTTTYQPINWTGYDSIGSYGTGLNNPGTTYIEPYCATYNCSPSTSNWTTPQTNSYWDLPAPTYTNNTWSNPTPTYTTGWTTPTYTNTYTGYTGGTYYVPSTTYPTYNTPTYYPTYNTPTYTQPSYNINTSTNTNTNTNTYWNYNTTTNTNTNNTCAGTNNCNTNTNYTYNSVINNTTTGSYNNTYVQPTYTQPTPVCTNGATNYPGCNICPSGLVYTNGYCITNVVTNNCPTNYYWNGTSCVPQTRSCPNGQTVSVWDVCPNQTQTCWNGTVIPVTSVCPSQYKICPNGTTVLISQQCYKTCPNGTTVPDTQACYRVCPNGTTVPDTQVCPIYNSYPTVDININPSIVNRGEGAVLTWTSANATYCTASNGWSGNVNLQGSMNRSNLLDTTTYTITCYNAQGQSASDSTTVTVRQNLPSSHRVVTTAVTQITKTSARCNGVGIISNGVYSNGWFEYGETRDLGRVTNSASIGNLPSSPFGNQITGLKSNTTYYCRAVMSNANGTYRGEIMSFRTTGDTITYIPVTPTNPKTPSKPIICTDDTGAKESLSDGQKLMSITLEKKSGDVVLGKDVEYRAHYLNTSKIKLTNVTIKIVLPSEMAYVLSSNRGMYDNETNTVTANLDTVGAGESGDLIVKVRVSNNAEVGRSAVISTYISYDALDSKGSPIRDENTAYIVSTIADSQDEAKNNTEVKTDNTKTSSDRSFLPNTVLEWLAITALILVLIVLGRSIYVGIKGEAHKGHH